MLPRCFRAHPLPQMKKKFFINSIKSLNKHGIFICGIPSLESQKYASKISKEGFCVNCKTGDELRKTLKNIFHNNFIFLL